jgi:tetratricopeptide (TPR) repeat protein
MAEQHRLNGNTAFKSNNYQQSIDSYTKSITLDQTNTVVYMNRAIARKSLNYSLRQSLFLNLDFKLNNYDASITDCSQVLSKDPHHIKGIFIKN